MTLLHHVLMCHGFVSLACVSSGVCNNALEPELIRKVTQRPKMIQEKNHLEKWLLRRCLSLRSNYMRKKLQNSEYYSTRLLYHHLKTFLWLLLLKFVTQESRGRIFKSTNELLDRIITISGLPSRQSSPTCFQESAGGVLQSGKRIPSKFKPSNGAAARRPRPTAPQPTEHSYRWDI